MLKKNNVSYFRAGFLMGLLRAGYPKDCIKDLVYKDLEFNNEWKWFLREYDKVGEFKNEEEELKIIFSLFKNL